MWIYAVIAAAGAALAGLLIRSAALRAGYHDVARAVIHRPSDDTVIDRDTGAVRSVQGAEVTLATKDLEELWTPMHLERLARTYWRYLSRCTLGIVRVKYTEHERFVCLLFRPLVLLAFQAPEYEMNADRGIVRWRIERGVLVSERGRGGNGYLEIDVRHRADEAPGRARLYVDVEVANFYPAIASGLGRWIYSNTQSRIHVIVTKGFLRSLERLDLAESRAGRFAALGELPDPPADGGPRRPDRTVTPSDRR